MPPVPVLPACLERKPLTRAVVTGYAAKVTAEDRAVQRDPFIAAMVWGYGRVGHGPSRVERIMAQPGFEEQLADVTRITLEQGGPAAFEHIRQQRKSGAGCLKHLGAAFGTKYLYFLTKYLYFLTKAHRESDIAPVLDSVVRAWFADHVRRGGLGLSVGLLVGRRNAAGGDGHVPGASPGCGLGAASESDTMHASMHASNYCGSHDSTLRPLLGQSCHGCRPPGPRRRLAHRPR